jgi:hypothetical protein
MHADLRLEEAILMFLDMLKLNLAPEEAFIWRGLDFEGTWSVASLRRSVPLNASYTAADHDDGRPLPIASCRRTDASNIRCSPTRRNHRRHCSSVAWRRQAAN